MTCCCKGNDDENVKHKQRDEQEKKALMTRLSRIEGQVRGIRAMVEDDRYCVDILTQVSAIQAALNGFNKELLARHIKTCVSEDIREGNDEVPVYMGEGCYNVISASDRYKKQGTITPKGFLRHRRKIVAGDITVTPFLCIDNYNNFPYMSTSSKKQSSTYRSHHLL